MWLWTGTQFTILISIHFGFLEVFHNGNSDTEFGHKAIIIKTFDKLYERIAFRLNAFNMYYKEEEASLIRNYEIVTGIHFLVK